MSGFLSPFSALFRPSAPPEHNSDDEHTNEEDERQQQQQQEEEEDEAKPQFQVPEIITKKESNVSKDIEMFPSMNSAQRASSSQRINPTSSSSSVSTAPPRRKVPLGMGHSPLDWANLKSRIPAGPLARYTISQVQEHNKQNDVWMVLQGKVYDVTTYVPFHPGGKSQLMRGAGKDATELFFKVHPWVNADRLLDKCHIGYLIKE